MSHSGNTLLFETIQIRDGIPQRLELHQERMDRSRRHFFSGSREISLQNLIRVPEDLREGVVKCKMIYGESIDSISFSPYTPRVHSGVVLVPIEVELDYKFKYTLRRRLDELDAQHADKAVILSCSGIITDATYANVAFYDGSRWLTPKHCLLNGVMRQWLLARGLIEEAEIDECDLTRFSSVKLMNAMLEWDESPILPLHSFNFH